MTDPLPSDAREKRGFNLPVILLVAANLVPLAGVLAWGWRVFDVVVLYWVENVIVGVINILKMLVCYPVPNRVDFRAGKPKNVGGLAHESRVSQPATANQTAIHHASKLFFVPFFTVHYGMFTLVHGVFVFALLGGQGQLGSGTSPSTAMGGMASTVLSGGSLLAVIALAASHLVSFVHHFLIRGEYRRTDVSNLMAAPYGRVVVLHIAILGGAFAIQALGSPIVLLVILIGGKIAIDLALHRRSHRKLEEKA